MHAVDWSIVVFLLLLLVVGAMTTRRYATSVSGFLAAERLGGRYLIAVSDNIARLGVVTLVWYFEQNYKVGFTSIWWTLMEEPVLIVMALSGWVIYRFRQTRAMTLAEFFEKRYSRRFRIFAGIVAFCAGIINFGIFPSVGARFFIRLWALPQEFEFLGLTMETFYPLMLVLLVVPLLLLLLGGQIAVIVTDFLQGIVANVAFIAIIFFLLLTYSWSQISETLMSAPAGQSMVDPFDLGGESHFGVTYYIITVITLFYAARGWQGTQGYNCSAINAHEAKMAYILGQWRFRVLMLITIALPICIKTFLTNPAYAEAASATIEQIAAIDTEPMRNQLRTPIAMHAMLPVGLLGLASAAMLGAFISTHDTYLHSWAAILVQDVVMPFHRKPLSEKAHLKLLRFAVVLIALFVFFFSMIFPHTDYIAMYCAASAAVFVGGAGSAIIGGLYWNRGTTRAAWCAMLTGMLLSLSGIVIEKLDPSGITDWLMARGAAGEVVLSPFLLLHHLTGQELNYIAIISSAAVYVLVSLAGSSRFNLDRMLHRGKYALAGESSLSARDARTFWEKLGFSREFTGTDRIVTYITLGWPLVWTIIFICVTACALTIGISSEAWLAYWRIWMWVILIVGALVTTWFTIGGCIDLRMMFQRLALRQSDAMTTDGDPSAPDDA